MKRSSSIALVMVSASALALTACDEPTVDAEVYSSLAECVRESQQSNEDCRKGFLAAREQHAKVAPKYSSRQDCMEDFGANQCERAPYETSGGGSVFMPIMAGYMMGRVLSGGSVFPQPLYRSADDSKTFRTADNRSVGRSTGPVRVAEKAARAPSAKGYTVSRGGFGARASSAGYSARS